LERALLRRRFPQLCGDEAGLEFCRVPFVIANADTMPDKGAARL